MNPEDAKNEMAQLLADIKRHEKLYRHFNAPEISDIEFDKLMHRLIELEEKFPQFKDPNSPTQRIGNDLSEDFEEVPHLSPMQSLDNVFDLQELRAFDARLHRALGMQVDDENSQSDKISEKSDNEIAAPKELDAAEKTSQSDAETFKKLLYCVEPKIDGAGISAVYENGELTRIVTRGNGTKGNDITRNAFLIRNLPLKLKGNFPTLLEVRGECYMTVSEFERIRKEQADTLIAKLSAKRGVPQGNFLEDFDESDNASLSPRAEDDDGSQIVLRKTGYANPRNLAAGTMKLLPKSFEENPLLKKRELLSVFYSIGTMQNYRIARQSELPETLKSWGLPCVDWFALADGVDAAYAEIKHFEKLRDDFAYNTDGAVLKLDNCALHEIAGSTGKAPRWAIAWKYAAERKYTRLNSITLQVGRTGAITPVAELEPVQLSGTRVARATLHNAGYIEQKDIREGDLVAVEKAGEIIPAVLEVDLSARPQNSKPFQFPTHCPECGAKLVLYGKKMLHRCPNFTCPPQVRERLIHFASRNCMDIEGLGDKMVEQLIDSFDIKSPADFYALTSQKLLSVERFRDTKSGTLSKTAANLLDALEDSKNRELWRLIFGLGILEIGAQFAKELSRRFGSLDSLANASLEEIKAMEGFGSKMGKTESVRALSIRAFFDEPHNLETIRRLREYGLNFVDNSAKNPTELPFFGKTFVLTGKLETMQRAQAESTIGELGGKCASSVSKNTNYLIASADAAGVKIDRARELGVNIISENEFLQLLKHSGLDISNFTAPIKDPQTDSSHTENENSDNKKSANKKTPDDKKNNSQMSLF